MGPNSSKIKSVVLFLGFIVLGIPKLAHSLDSTSSIIFQAMEEEMDRSLNRLKIDIFDPPYFIKYQVRHNRHIKIVGSFGSLIQSDHIQNRTLFVDVRIGDSNLTAPHQAVIDTKWTRPFRSTMTYMCSNGLYGMKPICGTNKP